MFYHFSEDPTIEIFRPRVKHNRQNMPPVVWAIDKEHEYTFYFPRNCPRIAYRKSDDISDYDNERFFGLTSATTIVAIESHWFAQLKDFTIYRYAFQEDGFELFDKYAGYYISHETVIPEAMEPVGDLIEKLLELGVELRLVPRLAPLREAILSSTVTDFGIHRFDFAKKG